jgi:hypothetical protein
MLANARKHNYCSSPASMEAGVGDTYHSKGGEARARSLSSEERSAIARKAAKARWDKINDPDHLPAASHSGSLKFGEVAVEAFRLDDGRRVISKKGMAAALTLKSEGGNAFLRSMTRKGVRSQIGKSLWEKIENPLFFRILGKDAKPLGTADGYEAATLIEVCKAIVDAFQAGALHASQYFLYAQAEIIIRASAKLGIVALVDEAVGYQPDAKRGEYQKLFEKFILDECKQWEQEFPDKFLQMIYRLYGLKRRDPDSTQTPRFFGKFIRKFIYAPLAHSRGAILAELDKKNPVVYAGGGRRYKMHQFLTDEIGAPALRQHLWQVIGVGNVSSTPQQFERNFYRAFPEAMPIGHQMDLLDYEG